jgi:hypothetical protein
MAASNSEQPFQTLDFFDKPRNILPRVQLRELNDSLLVLEPTCKAFFMERSYLFAGN